MKFTFAVVLCLFVSGFVIAKEKKGSEADSNPVFFCMDAESKSVRLEDAEAKSVAASCEGVRKSDKGDCFKKANSAFCKTKKHATPLYGELNEIPNSLSCSDFANKFLGSRSLGSLSKPSPSVNTTEAVTYSKSGLPKFQFNIANEPKTAVYASSEVNKETNAETWTLGVVATKNILSFENHFKKSPAVYDELKARTQDGEYRRLYRFKVVNNVCVLDTIDIEYKPKAPNGEENSAKYHQTERLLTQKECDHASPSLHGRNFHKSFRVRRPVDIMDSWICNESIASFNQPDAATTVSNGKRNGRGDQPAGRSR